MKHGRDGGVDDVDRSRRGPGAFPEQAARSDPGS